MVEVPDRFDWPAGWRPLPLPDGWLGLAGSAEAELAREVGSGHPLHGATCRAVGFNGDDPNEFLFATDRPATPLAFVHLTWQAERDPGWPYTVCYQSWEGFRAEWQTPEAERGAAPDRPRD
jgi:hypothetical protein